MRNKVKLFVFIMIAAIGCSRIVGRYEPMNAASYAIVIDKETKLIVDEELIEQGPVFVRPNQTLVQFSMVGDTIRISGNAITSDSIYVLYDYQFRFTYLKMDIIEIYKNYGFDYKEMYYVPEIIVLTREVISRVGKKSSEQSFKVELERNLKRFGKENHLHFQAVLNLQVVKRYSGEYFFSLPGEDVNGQ